jgi:ABC-type nitrate/sulfonate/bicarbonate transport system substrate-binding protein
METIRCTGVAEHFNFPWMLGIENGQFENAGIDLKWEDSAGGTGAMCKDLRDGKVDLTVILTEGATTDILNGNPSKIVSSYVNSPLIWGVHTSANSAIQDADSIQGFPFVISRFNSGSHLMGQLHAKTKGFTLNKKDFVVAGGLTQAIEGLKQTPNQLFLWEKFTTKPFVDSGELKILDECPTPWPSFIIVVRDEYLQSNFHTVQKVLSIVEENAKQLKASAETPVLIAQRYGLKYEDAVAWFNALDWSINFDVDTKMISSVTQKLADLNIIDDGLSPEEVKEKFLFQKRSETGILM